MANIDPVTGKNVGGRPKKAPAPAAGSIDSLIAELDVAKKDLIALNALCTDEASKRANAEGIRKIVSSQVELRLKDARAKSLAQEHKEAERWAHQEDLEDIYKTLAKSLDSPLAAATLHSNVARGLKSDKRCPSWIAGLVVDPAERRAAGIDRDTDDT